MIVEFIVYFTLGATTGYVLADKGRRSKILAKLNDWTKPKKEPVQAEDKKA